MTDLAAARKLADLTLANWEAYKIRTDDPNLRDGDLITLARALLSALDALEAANKERDEYRIEADCGLRDYDGLEVTAGIYQDALERIAAKRPNKTFDPWAVEVAAAALASVAEPPAPTPTLAWLIEKQIARDPDGFIWLAASPAWHLPDEWTNDPNKARQFPTRDEAEAHIEKRDILGASAVEHGWLAPASPASAGRPQGEENA